MTQSVEAALTVLKAVSSNPGCGLSELTKLTGLNKSRVYRLLCVLVDNCFVRQAADGKYFLDYQSLLLGQAAASQIDLASRIEEAVSKYLSSVDENIQARIRDGDEVVQIFSRKSSQRLRVESKIGNRRPLGLGASGQVLLAYGPDMENWVKDDTEAQRLRQIRGVGYCITHGELTEGVSAIAVPIFDRSQNVVASLSASIPSARLTDEYQQQILDSLLNAATDLFR